MNLFSKFWNGQTPLWINVWLLGVIFLHLLFIGSLILADKYEIKDDHAWIMLFPIYIYWAVGTWRSASNYKGKKLWELLAKLYVIIKCPVQILGTLYLMYFA